VTVLNVNGTVLRSAGLVCYVPEATAAHMSGRDAVEVRHLLRQGCINAIVGRIETIARTGFACLLPHLEQAVTKSYCCRPFLCCMQLDSKETYAYAGLRSERCCPWCRLRPGRSLFRTAREHDRAEITSLWAVANPPVRSAARRAARLRLGRHGWHPTRRCGLLDVAKSCLLPGPVGGGVLRGIIGVDVLHGLYIAWNRYLFGTLRKLLPSETSKARKALDSVIAGFVLRDPETGKRQRNLDSLLGQEGLTAEKRVMLMVLLATALGTSGGVLGAPREIVEAVTQSVASAEVVFLACRGHRSYTEDELSMIFKDQAMLFFGSLAKVMKYADEQVMRMCPN